MYKALHTTNRFSEDIDLSVDASDCSRSQNDRRLEKATKKYTSLNRDAGQGITNRSEVIAVYSYEPITDYDREDALQRFGKLKIEAAKRFYDLAVMRKLPRIIKLISNEHPLDKILDIRIKEEMHRLDGVPGLTPEKFTFFDDIKDGFQKLSWFPALFYDFCSENLQKS